MHRRMLVPACIAAACIAAACIAAAGLLSPTAQADTQTYDIEGFTSVRSSAGIQVTLKQGPFAVSAEGDGQALERLKIEKKNDTLVVTRKTYSGVGASGRVAVTVTAPQYKALDAAAGAAVKGVDLALETIAIDVSSGAHMQMTGSCTTLAVEASSGARFDGGMLKCTTASATASSGASADVFASDSFEGNASSGGSIEVHGAPKAVSQHTSSGGSVNID